MQAVEYTAIDEDKKRKVEIILGIFDLSSKQKFDIIIPHFNLEIINK